MTAPSATPPGAGTRPLRRSRGPVWQMIAIYGVLTMMALGDAYGFYSVLIGLFLRDSFLVLLLVVALTLGAVAGAHEIGRLARSRRDGGDESIWWITTLAAIWLTVGAVIMWLRAVTPISTVDEAAGMEEFQVALVLLGLYLLTGSLAMTAAYRFSGPRAAELRSLIREREKAERDASTARDELERSQARLEQVRGERQRDDDQYRAESERIAASGKPLKEHAKLHIAEAIEGGPATTDGVLGLRRGAGSVP